MIKDPTFIRTYLTHTLKFNTQNSTHLLLLHSVFSDDDCWFLRETPIQGFKEDLYSLHYENPAFGEYSIARLNFQLGSRKYWRIRVFVLWVLVMGWFVLLMIRCVMLITLLYGTLL
ncbi:hypothetical protein RchiOBHm_Chr5g0028101 [Rosa chinensis]|uniref:Uncharacterized protein n=1 Tax=Rosa chinensis TaxID=74649 RepID=A0A2P6Q9A3_ROSCH|nr:hypothetical protein RchiOBHm_Chr5g0028101 [Rosa chinensis]